MPKYLKDHLDVLAHRFDGFLAYGNWNTWIVFPNRWKLSVGFSNVLNYIEIAVINPEGNRVAIDGDECQMGLDTVEELTAWAEKVANYD